MGRSRLRRSDGFHSRQSAWSGESASECSPQGIFRVLIASTVLPQAVGAYSGGKIGQIRDAKGKAVATVFMSLSADKKYSVLQSLLAKVMAQVAS